MRKKAGLVLVPVTLSLGVSGCFKNFETEFPPGVEPIDKECRAAAPAPKNGDEHPEELVLENGWEKGYSWVHGHAYVHANIKDTWDCMRERDVCADRRAVYSWEAEDNVEEGYADSYVIHNEVHDTIVVNFDVTWRHDPLEGTVDDPQVVAARYQKTWGTEFIDLLSGSVIATKIDEDTTDLQIMEHIVAARDSVDKILQYETDYYANVLACVRGEPAPQY